MFWLAKRKRVVEMERIKKRKLKFLCLFGGNDDTPRCRPIQPRSPASPKTEQSLLKFEVGKSTSKQRKENRMKRLLAKGVSAKKRSPTIITKFMGRGRLSSRNSVRNPKATNIKTVDHSSNECRKKTEHFESGHAGSYGYDYFGDENLVLRNGSFSESEEITAASIIVFDQNDRLTHSLSCTSESSLISEATNRMLIRLNTTRVREDTGTVGKVSILGEMHSFPFHDKETRPTESDNVTGLLGVNDIFASPTGLGTILGNCERDGVGDEHFVRTSRSTSLSSSFNDPDHERNVCHEDDADEKVCREPSNQGRREVQNDFVNHENVRSEKSTHSSHESSGTCFENEDPAKYQPSSSNTDVDVDAQLSGPESEDGAFHSDCFESINSRLRDLKKNLHLLKAGSKLVSNNLTLIPKVKHTGQVSRVATPELVSREYSLYMAHILETLETYANDPDTSSLSWEGETMHHPIDPRLFYCLEEFYFEGTTLLRNEKRLFYDYIEQMFSRASKSTVAYPWVNPAKRESQRRSPKLSLASQIHNVVNEIEKDEDENFFTIYIDKDSMWVQPTNEIDILGKLIADLVLHDLLLEVVDL